MKKIVSILLAVLLLTSVFSITAFAEGEELEVWQITEDGEYTIDCDQHGPVDIIGATATVTLDGVNLQAAEEGFRRSPIKVSGGAKVTFVLVGFNTIKGVTEYGDNLPESARSCGIEVEYGSEVTFTGNGTLNVTGGNYGAAIGSWGTGINIEPERRTRVGAITIESGNIFAYGGYKGSGIGSGYHVDNNCVTINGGVIHAYGLGGGAGIGTGYGTSGNAKDYARTGDYSAGKIVINGGEIYAATTWDASFDYSDLETLNINDPNNFAAGIGGGYGSSAPDIEINGGKVVAIGSCGGTGIGSGRGTSKLKNYNPDTFSVNIKIGGDADVTAIAASRRAYPGADLNEVGQNAGAAIGSGRGTHTGGTIEITGNAKVVAISATQAPAIGASKQKSPVDGTIPVAESIIIGDNVTLYAVSAGDYAVDKDASTLSISDDYFGSSDRWFFGEDAVAISDITNVKAESTKGEKTYAVPANSVSLWANIVPTTPPEPVVPKTSLDIVAPLAMALRFEDGSVYYSGDSVEELELDKDYHFQMCCVDWSTRDVNAEKKIHKPYETFYPAASAWQHVNHGIYSDEGVGLRGTVVYAVRISSEAKRSSYDEATKTFILPKNNRVLRTDVNKCFMAYRFQFEKGNYNKQTGIDNVVYDTGIEHENTLEEFQYNKPLEFLSVNLPLGSTVTAKAYINYELVGTANVFVCIDEENPGESWKDYFWPY